MGETPERQKAQSIIDAFKDVLNDPRQPKAIRTDKGSEFYNQFLKRYFKEKGIKIFLCAERDQCQFCRKIHLNSKEEIVSLFYTYSKTQVYGHFTSRGDVYQRNTQSLAERKSPSVGQCRERIRGETGRLSSKTKISEKGANE